MKHARWRPIVGSFLIAVAISSVSTAFVNLYNEDFTTETFRDTNATTADWSTADGELRLPLFEASITGVYDTPGGAWNVKVSGSHAFVGDFGNGLQVIDISDPSNPTLVGNAAMAGTAFGVDVAGQHAYVAADAGGVHVVDISNRSNPMVVGSVVPAGLGNVVDIVVAGNFAYVCDQNTGGIGVININNPLSPSLVTTRTTPGEGRAVDVSGNYLFVADGTSGLRVFDISVPASLSEVGFTLFPGNDYRGVTVDGQFAYAVGQTGLQIVDVSDPTNPVVVGSLLTTAGFTYDAVVSGGYAYLVGSPRGVDVVDVSDPTNPVLVDNVATLDGSALGVDMDGNRLYVADWFMGGLHIMDIADSLTAPLLAGAIDTPGEARSVATAGNIVYVADASSGLQVVSIVDPVTPVLVSGYDTPGSAEGLALSGAHVYVADGDSLLVVSVSDSTAPSRVGAVETPGTASDVDVSGDIAIVADGGSGIQVVFIEDVTNPSIIGNSATTGSASGVEIDGSRLMVADGPTGLQIFSISNPFSPSLLGSYDTPGLANDVTVSGDVACVADGDSGVQFIDVNNPASPSLLGNFQTNGAALGITVAGDMAFVAADSGLQVVDFNDPTAPTLIASYPTGTDMAWDVTIAGDYAMVANAALGVRSIQVYQRRMMPDANVGQSFELDAAADTIRMVRLSTQETGTIMWELSADGGSTFEQVTADGTYHTLANPGNALVWRATLLFEPTDPKANPTVTDMMMDWLYDFAVVDSIVDVPNDQGKQVSISWGRSAGDFVGASPQVTEYAVHRRIDPNLSTGGGVNAGREVREFESTASMAGWEFLMTVPADAEEQYAIVAPTLKDSTIMDGIYHSVFLVRARTASPGNFTDSPPDSGYSIDNLVPGVPPGLVVAFIAGSGYQLNWEFPSDGDVQYFKVYRSSVPDFVPGASNLVHSTGNTQWMDPVSDGTSYSYKVSAVDFSGNEGSAATAQSQTVPPNPKLPSTFALYQSSPNPFNPSTVIKYDVPGGGGKVSLKVFDVGGRLIRTLVDAHQSPGEKQATWNGKDNGGKNVASGVYFYRLQAPGFERTMKMTLLQ